jgi:hypothetical protein
MSYTRLVVAAVSTLIASPAYVVGQSPVIHAFAGTGLPGTGGDGSSALAAELSYPLDVCVDRAGNVYLEDHGGNLGIPDRIRRVDANTGLIETVAGGGLIAFPNDGLHATQIQLAAGFHALAVDSAGNLHFAEEYAIGAPNGPFGGPVGHAHRIRRVDVGTGVVSTVAGNGLPLVETLFVCGHPYIVLLPAGDGMPAIDAGLNYVNALAFDSNDNLYIAGGASVRRIDGVTEQISTVAGNDIHEIVGFGGNPCSGWVYSGVYSGDGGAATLAGLVSPLALAFDAFDNLFISDGDYAGGFGVPGRSTNHRVRRVDALTGIITTVCGTSQAGYGGFAGDGGPAITALIGPVWGLAVDAAGNLFLSDSDNSRLRRVDAVSNIIDTIAGDGSFIHGGDGGPAAAATFAYLFDLHFAPDGDLYLTDADSYRARRISGLTSNLPPTAHAGEPQSIHAGALVQLDGSSSFDDNTESMGLGFDWTLVSWPPSSNAVLLGASTPSPTFVADQPGAYVVRLVVIDEAGLVSLPAEVSVSSTNLAPIASAGLDAVVLVMSTVQLDGTASFDPELDPLTYAWALVAAPAGSAATLDDAFSVTPIFVPDLEGTYLAALFVDDGFGPSLVDEVVVTALGGEQYAEVVVIEAVAAISDLTSAEVTSGGNQESLVKTLSTAAQALDHGNDTVARNRLEAALARTDGCVLRGAPDLQGAGRDWVTDCAAQAILYADLIAALQAIQ